MRFPPSLLDEIRARLPVSQVVARKVALKRAGREFKGLSPFKNEKTPSFTVNDQKGFYHCFASGEHGDIFTFLMKTEGITFPEAVERLAQEAGVPIPKAGPRDAEAEDQRTRLYELLAASAAFFERQLAAPQGREARQYLAKRGLDADGIARFRLGYAPNSKSALKEHLASGGFTAADMAASGMLIAGDDIPVSYDRFRHRITFPICDLKGRTVAFGGRALDPDSPPKYLNSPETPLFHKGATLFNAHNARAPAHDKGQLIVVEGYMDVIALSLAGFPQTVAPLGTALTENQIGLLWRMAHEPILCFDGDAAGRRAAFRAVETVLPHLKPGYSLQFAFLPEGLDPDDLVRQQGPGAVRDILEGRTRALFDVLIEREEQQGPPAVTPEQTAALGARLRGMVGQIRDPDVRGRYSQELRETLWAKSSRLMKALAPAGGRRRPTLAGKRRDNTQLDWRVRERANERARLGGPPRAAAPQIGPARSNALSDQMAALPPREVLLVGALINHPWLVENHCEDIARLTLISPPLQRLKQGLLDLLNAGIPLDPANVRTHLNAGGLDSVVAAVDRAMTHTSDKFARPDAGASEAEAGWCHAFALHETQVGLPLELQLAERAWRTEQSEEAWERIMELHDRLGRGVDQGLNQVPED
ncbi:MAG TPA: DNA primase [Hyphomicrobiaceae bacterium]|jgi:DNA primase|nr:DNA primase [Hyphomicrobiaceae bacterium]